MGFLINEAPLSMTFYECGKLIRSLWSRPRHDFLASQAISPATYQISHYLDYSHKTLYERLPIAIIYTPENGTLITNSSS